MLILLDIENVDCMCEISSHYFVINSASRCKMKVLLSKFAPLRCLGL